MTYISNVTPAKLLQDLSNPATCPTSFVVSENRTGWGTRTWEVIEMNSFFGVSQSDDCKLKTANNLNELFKDHAENIVGKGKKMAGVDPQKLVTALEGYRDQFAKGMSSKDKQDRVIKSFNDIIKKLNDGGYRGNGALNTTLLTLAPGITLLAASFLSGQAEGSAFAWTGALALAFAPKIVKPVADLIINPVANLANKACSIVSTGGHLVNSLRPSGERLLWASPVITLLASSILSGQITGNEFAWAAAIATATAPDVMRPVVSVAQTAYGISKWGVGLVVNLKNRVSKASPALPALFVAADQYFLRGTFTGGMSTLAALGTASCSKDRIKYLLAIAPTVIQVADRLFNGGRLTGDRWAGVAFGATMYAYSKF